MTVTKEQAEMLTALTVAARPHGARRWDGPGVMAALGKVRHMELAEVMMAAGRAARDRDLETPAAIGNPAAVCWVERPVERAVPVKTLPEDRCGICARPRQACESAPRFADDDHTFEPDFKVKRPGEQVEQITAAVKAEIQPTIPPPERKSLDDLPPEQRDPRAKMARDLQHGDLTETTPNEES